MEIGLDSVSLSKVRIVMSPNIKAPLMCRSKDSGAVETWIPQHNVGTLSSFFFHKMNSVAWRKYLGWDLMGRNDCGWTVSTLNLTIEWKNVVQDCALCWQSSLNFRVVMESVESFLNDYKAFLNLSF